MKTIEPEHELTDIPAVITNHPELSRPFQQPTATSSHSEELLDARRKREYSLLRIPLYLSLALIAGTAFFRLTPLLVFGDPFSGVFIAIGIGLVALGIILWNVRAVAITAYHNDLVTPVFFVSYALAFLFPAAWVYMGSNSLSIESWFLLVGMLIVLSGVTALALAYAQKFKQHRFAKYLALCIALTALNGFILFIFG